MQIKNIPIDLIDSDPNQPRKHFDQKEIQELSTSIKQFGQCVPALVKAMGERFRVVDGDCRLRAAALAGIPTLLCIIVEDGATADHTFMTQLVVNCVRNDLNPIDRARAYQQLMESKKWSASELASYLAVSKGNVTRYLSHLTLDPDQQAKLERGELSSANAYALARMTSEAQTALLDRPEEKPRREQFEQLARKKKEGDNPKVKSIRFELPDCTLSLSSGKAITIDSVAAILQSLIKACKEARSQKIDVSTMAAVIKDKTAFAKAQTNAVLSEAN